MSNCWSGEPSRVFDDTAVARIAFLHSLPSGAHIHIIGICGTGTGAVLQLLVAKGFRVTGSDKAFYPPMGDIVRQYASEVFEGYSEASFVQRPDCVIVGNTASVSNPEVQFVLREAIPFCSMPEAVSAFLIGTREDCPTSIVIAGTHGKTTTTALTTWLFESAGRSPAYFIGGVALNFSDTIRTHSPNIPTAQRVVVLEGDEYDSAFFAKYSKFHSYRPDILVVTSLEFDHGDIFPSIEAIEDEFERLAASMPEGGRIFVSDSYPRLVALAARWREKKYCGGNVLVYGTSADAEFRLVRREQSSVEVQLLTLSVSGVEFEVAATLSGQHNAYNTLIAATVAYSCGVESAEIQAGVASFKGVKRRQECIFNYGEIQVVEDFAHHPTAVETTLAGIQEAYNPQRLLVAFDPRSNTSRRDFFQDHYAKAFQLADHVFIKQTDVLGAYSQTGEVRALDLEKLVSDIADFGTVAKIGVDAQDIAKELAALAQPGDCIVLMSNGSFEGLPQELPKLLRARIDAGVEQA